MSDDNLHHGTGRLGIDPKIITGESGSRVAKLFAILNESYADRSGVKHESTLPLNLIALKPADVALAATLHKGDAISWGGKLAVRSFVDKEGRDRTATEILIAGPGSKLELVTAKSAAAEAIGERQKQAAPGHVQ